MNITRHTREGGESVMASTKTRTFTPKELAEELGVSPKVLRAWLRDKHARAAEAKNTSWVITAKVAAEARKAFAKNKAGSK